MASKLKKKVNKHGSKRILGFFFRDTRRISVYAMQGSKPGANSPIDLKSSPQSLLLNHNHWHLQCLLSKCAIHRLLTRHLVTLGPISSQERQFYLPVRTVIGQIRDLCLTGERDTIICEGC